MKKLLGAVVGILLSTTFVGATDIDTSIEEALKSQEVKESTASFSLKTFQSCQNLEDVMEGYIKDYYKVNKNNQYRRGGIMVEPMMMEMSDGVSANMAVESVAAPSTPSDKSLANTGGGEDVSFSKTNSQVTGVDESDIIKTDGEHVYYYNQGLKKVFIIHAYGTDKMKILKEIALPKSFSQPVMYIASNKLVIVASGYSNTNYAKRGYYINRNAKTYTVIFDTTNKSTPKLEKLYINDGGLKKSRKIGRYLYVISNNNFNIPYHSFNSEDDIDVNISNVIPKKLEISKTNDSSKQNLRLKGKTLPFNMRAGNVAKCSEIEYSLPDEETLKKYGFNPSYNIVSVIDTSDVSKEVETKVVAGNNSEIYMSMENLYLTDSIYQANNYSCPADAMCAMPMFYGGMTNTLVHKMNVLGNSLKYKQSAILPGMPLTQYSMDEKDDHFRIITTTNNWNGGNKKHTDLFILDKDLKLVSSVNNLGEGENFQSSRFMGDKLFLVTFKQVDPLYVIDLADQKNPEIIGELKIPGYSTYLHPYDSNHLIGLGFDTYETKYGATRNGGLKVDLYEINYDKKVGISTDCEKYSDLECPGYCNVIKPSNPCSVIEGPCSITQALPYCSAKQDDEKKDYIEVKQKFTYTLGDEGSNSEATHNPRMFMWNNEEKSLFLPATLYTKFEKGEHRNKDFFQGLVTLNIDKNTGISEKYRLTHLDYKKAEDDRMKECSKYSQKIEEEQECKTLFDGSEYCPSARKSYVPEYCYSDSTVGEYLANNFYKQRNSIVKRGLWIGNNVYSISDDTIMQSDISTGQQKDILEMK